MADTSNLTNFLGDIADAIRNKKGTTDAIPAAEFDREIATINSAADLSDADATVEDLLYPKVAYTKEGRIIGDLIPTYKSLGDESIAINSISVEPLNFAITDVKLEDNICVGVSGNREIVIAKVLGNTIVNEDKITLGLTNVGITTTTAYIRDVKFSEKLDSGEYVLWIASKEPSPHRATVKVYVSCLKYNPETHAIDPDYLQIINYQSGNYCTGDPECEHITIFPFEHDGAQKCMWFLNTREQLNGVGITSFDTFTLSGVNMEIVRTTGGAFTLEATSHAGCYREGAIMIQKIGNTVLLLVPYNQLSTYSHPYMWSAVTILSSGGNLTTSHIIPPAKNRNMFLVSEQVAYIDGAYYTLSNLGTPVAPSSITLTGNDMGIYYNGFIFVFKPTESIVSIYKFSLETYQETFLKNQTIDWALSDTTLKKLGILPYITSQGMMYGANLSRVGPYTGKNNAILYDYYTADLAIASVYSENNYLYSLDTKTGTLYNTMEATALNSDILLGKVGFNSHGPITGTMPNNGALNYTPSEDTQTIPAGYTTGGAVKSVMNSAVYRRCLTSAKSILGEVEVDIPINGQLLYLSGKKNNGVSFDNGATTWVNLADDTEIPLASGSWNTDYSLTFSNLAIDTKVPQSDMKDAYTVLMQVYNTGADFGGWGLYGIGGTYSRETGSWIRMYHGSSNIILTKQAANYYNSWHIIAYTFDGVSRTAIGYIDGTQLVSGTLPALSPTGNFILGMAEQDAAYFGGRMRNIAIYNRVLSAQEIKDIGTIWAV